MFEERHTRENWHTMFAMGIDTWCLPEYRPSFSLPPVCKLDLRITQPPVPVSCAAALPLLAAVPSPRSCECRRPKVPFEEYSRFPFDVPLTCIAPSCLIVNRTSFLPLSAFFHLADLLPLRIQAAERALQPSQTIRPAQGKEQQQRPTRSAAAPPGIQSRAISTGAVHGVIPLPPPPLSFATICGNCSQSRLGLLPNRRGAFLTPQLRLPGTLAGLSLRSFIPSPMESLHGNGNKGLLGFIVSQLLGKSFAWATAGWTFWGRGGGIKNLHTHTPKKTGVSPLD